jgi:septal ring factor EnvC (AmiA/AmiB activator)
MVRRLAGPPDAHIGYHRNLSPLPRVTSSDIADKTTTLERTLEELADARCRLADVDGRLAEALASLDCLRTEHATVCAKHAQREADFDLLLAEQHDTAARLAAAEEAARGAAQHAQQEAEGVAGLADQVGPARVRATSPIPSLGPSNTDAAPAMPTMS